MKSFFEIIREYLLCQMNRKDSLEWIEISDIEVLVNKFLNDKLDTEV